MKKILRTALKTITTKTEELYEYDSANTWPKYNIVKMKNKCGLSSFNSLQFNTKEGRSSIKEIFSWSIWFYSQMVIEASLEVFSQWFGVWEWTYCQHFINKYQYCLHFLVVLNCLGTHSIQMLYYDYYPIY